MDYLTWRAIWTDFGHAYKLYTSSLDIVLDITNLLTDCVFKSVEAVGL